MEVRFNSISNQFKESASRNNYSSDCFAQVKANKYVWNLIKSPDIYVSSLAGKVKKYKVRQQK